MSHPQKIETVHIEKLDNELCIYDWQRLEVHSLNPTAALVWELCDGQTSPAQIAEKLQAELNTPHAEALVWLTLQRLERANLLQGKVAPPAGPQREVITRRELLKGLGVAAALLPVVSSIVAPGPIEAQSPQPGPTPTATRITGSRTFNFTGAEQQFVVPAGVTSVTIDASGAQGGLDAPPSSPPAGLGGRTVATIAVTPGETLFVYVGGQGGTGTSSTGGVGGFNGGAAGGFGGTLGAGGGGGASDVRQSGNGLGNRVLVSGGGGGNDAGGQGQGGNGGGLTGADGVNIFNPTSSGKGGTQASGGAGGIGGTTTGANGSSGIGGAGANAGSVSGGGGGGGYFGGGGGGGSDSDPLNSGGGGGGSSFAIPAATSVTHQQGVRSGNGVVVISW